MPKKSSGQGHDTPSIRLQKNYCFACGNNNPEGMRLKFTYDEERHCFVSRFRLASRVQAQSDDCRHDALKRGSVVWLEITDEAVSCADFARSDRVDRRAHWPARG